jgi:translation initiation factor IF-2
VLLLIAADDGIKPQTVEAIKFIKKSNSKLVVVFNKIDKPQANIQKAKNDIERGKRWVFSTATKIKECVDKINSYNPVEYNINDRNEVNIFKILNSDGREVDLDDALLIFNSLKCSLRSTS